MREILFRGKRVDNGEWVVGYYTKGFRFPNETQLLDMIYAFIKTGNAFEFECFAVDTNTVGQYTGLCDKNGTKIFERDIVVWDNGEGRIVKPFEVAFDSNYGYMFCARKNYHDNSMSDILDINFIDIDKKSIEVIGNIYDNKKLIEEQDK